MGQSENRSWNLTSVIQVDGRGFFLLSVSWCAEATTLSGNYLSRNGFQKEEEISHVRIFHRAISCAAARQRTSEPNS